jgi:hypothetical protein
VTKTHFYAPYLHGAVRDLALRVLAFAGAFHGSALVASK